jgi:hypothetical protein
MPQRKPARPKSKPSVSPHKPAPPNATKLTKTEQDLLSHLEQGYQLESEAFGNGLLLRNLKDNSVVRPASANQSTIDDLVTAANVSSG